MSLCVVVARSAPSMYAARHYCGVCDLVARDAPWLRVVFLDCALFLDGASCLCCIQCAFSLFFWCGFVSHNAPMLRVIRLCCSCCVFNCAQCAFAELCEPLFRLARLCCGLSLRFAPCGLGRVLFALECALWVFGARCAALLRDARLSCARRACIACHAFLLRVMFLCCAT